MAKRFLVLIALLMLGFYVSGCSEGDDSASVVNPNPSTFVPTGSISGVVYDSCTYAPIQGAVVSVAYSGSVRQVTTGTSGGFSFTKVPVNWVTGSDFDWGSDYGYLVTCDLTNKTGYGYAWVSDEVYVYAGDLNDGDNYALGEYDGQTEGGSGADTPVHGLNASVEFSLAQPNASIAGTIYDVTTGRAATGATVGLYAGSKYITQTTTTTGAFSFTNVIPNLSYTLMVVKAGYDFADFQTDKVGNSINAGCQTISVDCGVGCGQALAGVDVNLIYNPDKDVTRPFITQIDVNDDEDIWEGDYTAADPLAEAITEYVISYSESMKTSHNVKSGVTSVIANMTVSVSTNGDAADISSAVQIVDDYTVEMDSSGFMTIELVYVDEEDILDEVLADTGSAWDADNCEIAGYVGSYVLTLAENSYFVTDLALNPWNPDDVDAVAPYNSPSAVIQAIILGGAGDNALTIPADFDEL